MTQEEFKRGDKFIVTLGERYDNHSWLTADSNMIIPDWELRLLHRYVEPTEQTEIPLFVREALNRRADELLKKIGERVKDLEEERDAIMDFLNGKPSKKESV